MALFVEGMICELCGKPMHSSEKIQMFPEMIQNRSEKLHVFSDGVFHFECVASHSLGDCAKKVAFEQTCFFKSEKKCSVSGNPILVEDVEATLFLTSNEMLQAHKFNFKWYSRSVLKRSNVLQVLLSALEELQDSQTWNADDLKPLADHFRSL